MAATRSTALADPAGAPQPRQGTVAPRPLALAARQRCATLLTARAAARLRGCAPTIGRAVACLPAYLTRACTWPLLATALCRGLGRRELLLTRVGRSDLSFDLRDPILIAFRKVSRLDFASRCDRGDRRCPNGMIV